MKSLQTETNTELDKNFKQITESLRNYLAFLKEKFDKFDSENSNKNKRIQFVKNEKQDIFSTLDMYFAKSWEIASVFNFKKFKIHQYYYYDALSPLLEIAEINKHIYTKPLGYPGDYITMNYIYDYYGDQNFLGETSYEMLINNYTCNLPFSKSNIIRKDFFKNKLLEIIKTNEYPKILSIGNGPIRELFELLKENKIERKIDFICLDFQEASLNYVMQELNKSTDRNKKFINIEFRYKNIVEILKNKFEKEEIQEQDFIYISGVFDYLTDRFTIKLIKEFYELLKKRGSLIICNASQESHSHRAYYEILGKWNMLYRTEEQVLSWCENLDRNASAELIKLNERIDYLFLSIKKITVEKH